MQYPITDNIDKTIVLGSDGRMARLFLPYLPEPKNLIDVKRLDRVPGSLQRPLRRLISSRLKELGGNLTRPSGVHSLCLLSIPNEVYQEADTAPGKAKLPQLLGVSGRGYRSTLFVHQSSVHSAPARVLDAASGMVFGIHPLHGPNVGNFQDQTVVITATEKKKRHHNYTEGCRYLNRLLKDTIGYSQVFHMSPDRHDYIMANIQFLTHSMLLILSDALLSAGFEVTSYNYHTLPASLFVLIGRMRQQPAHVYKGIAEFNERNHVVIHEMKAAFAHCAPMRLLEALERFNVIRHRLAKRARLSSKEQQHIRTPMSSVRDGLLDSAKYDSLSRSLMLDMSGSLKRYLQATHNNYEQYFQEITSSIPHDWSNLEVLVMKRYGDSIR